MGSPSRGRDVARSFSFCFCVSCCFYGPFNCILFHAFFRHLSACAPNSSSIISALLILSTTYLFMKVSLSPDIILCGWMGLKYQLTNYYGSVPCGMNKVLLNTEYSFFLPAQFIAPLLCIMNFYIVLRTYSGHFIEKRTFHVRNNIFFVTLFLQTLQCV